MSTNMCIRCGGVMTPRLKTYRAKNGLRHYPDRRCPKCEAVRQRERRKNPTYKFKIARSIATRRGLEWQLTEAEYLAIRSLACHYCGFGLPETGMATDRLDNRFGYIPGNVVPCCAECNIARGASFTPEEMMVLGAAIAEIKRKRRAEGREDHKFGAKQKYE